MIRSLLAWLRRFWIVLAVLVGLLLSYTLAGFWLVPHLARKAMQDYAARIGCQATLGEFAFNPFTFDLRTGPFSLTERSGAALVAFKALHINAELASVWQRAVVLREVWISAPDVALIVEADGSVNLAKLAPQDEPATPEPVALPRIHIGSFSIEEGRLGIEDRSRPKPFAMALSPIRFTLTEFRTDLGHENAYQVSGKTLNDEQLEWSGGFTVQPIGSAGTFAIRNLQAQTLQDYLQDLLPMRLAAGVAELGGSYKLTLDPALALDIELPAVTVRELAVAERGSNSAPPVTIGQIGLQSLKFSLGQRDLAIQHMQVNGARITAQREKDGKLNLLRLLAPEPATKPVQPPAGQAAKPEANGWRVGIQTLALEEAAIELSDQSVTPATRFSLTPVAATVRGFSTGPSTRLEIELDAGINKSGHLHSRGDVQLEPLSARLSLELSNFGLPVLQPYLREITTLTVQAGQMGLKGELAYTAKPNTAAQLSFTGALDVNGFNFRDQALRQDLIKWRRLGVSGIDYRQSPDRLTIEQVALREPYARVVIQPDRTLNLAQVLKQETAQQGSVTSGGAEKTEATGSVPKMPIRIKTIRVENGTTDFADLSIEPQFAAAIIGLKGSVTGLSSDPASRARIALEGSVDQYAPVTISGEANLLAATQYSDIAMSFRNMELTTFNPYSGRYAGYNITKGKLTTELRYKVQNRQLEAEHHVVLDQLEFGEATGSKQKVPLPIKLAVALLKNRQGVIDIQLPVRGSLDDPAFRVGPIIWQAFINLLTKAVTAPFALLGSLFGGGEQLSYVDFAAGSANLIASEADKLKKLATALVERPQLKLDVPLTLVEAQDRQAMAQTALDQLVPPLTSTEASGKADKTRLRALESAFVRLTNETLVYPPETASDKQAETQTKIEYLEKTLMERLAPNAAALEQLAKTRAQAVQTTLLTGTQIAPERIFITVRRSTATTEAGGVRMELKLE